MQETSDHGCQDTRATAQAVTIGWLPSHRSKIVPSHRLIGPPNAFPRRGDFFGVPADVWLSRTDRPRAIESDGEQSGRSTAQNLGVLSAVDGVRAATHDMAGDIEAWRTGHGDAYGSDERLEWRGSRRWHGVLKSCLAVLY